MRSSWSWRKSLVVLALTLAVSAAQPAAHAQQAIAPGAVVGLQGTPHLWIADEHGVLHWAGDTRALTDRSINWSDRREIGLAELQTYPVGDPWLSTGLLKDGDPIYLVKWESEWTQPRLLHIQSIADVELFGINGSNYGDFVLEKRAWEQRFGIAANSLPRGVLAPTIRPGCIPTFSPTPPDRTAVIDYFLEIAFGSEFGSSEPVIRKWKANLSIQVHGHLTRKDRETLDQVVSELNHILGSERLSLVDENPNVNIHFVRVSFFRSIIPAVRPNSIGYFSVRWRGSSEIQRATILIATDVDSQKIRSHLIREELTQVLGLMKDSETYPDSIFYDPPSEVTAYTAIDRELIWLLYLDDVVAGMDGNDLQAFLSQPFCSG